VPGDQDPIGVDDAADHRIGRHCVDRGQHIGDVLVVGPAERAQGLGRDAPFGHDTVEAALTINPVAAALSVIHVQGFQGYDLIPANWWFLGVASAASLLLMLLQTWRISRPA
ncbi:MAG: hypothetical protein ACF8TS_06820, partial [Maioricimonas sp. JB049]